MTSVETSNCSSSDAITWQLIRKLIQSKLWWSCAHVFVIFMLSQKSCSHPLNHTAWSSTHCLLRSYVLRLGTFPLGVSKYQTALHTCIAWLLVLPSSQLRCLGSNKNPGRNGLYRSCSVITWRASNRNLNVFEKRNNVEYTASALWTPQIQASFVIICLWDTSSFETQRGRTPQQASHPTNPH